MAMDLSKMFPAPSTPPDSNRSGSSDPATLPVPRARPVDSRLGMADRLGAWRVRWGIRRNQFRVEPGLYGLNKPGRNDPVLVTANYRLTFDILRRDLQGQSAWILVLDTKGINVWCAAGKGTFSTSELARRLASSGLEAEVDHRTLILPQLGATGVSAPGTKTLTGWKVVWGPVRSSDLPAFLKAGMKADESMREVLFPMEDRMVLAPVELVQSLKFLPAAPALAALLALPAGSGWLARFACLTAWLALSVPVGAVAFPLLLPFLPGKGFGMRSLVLGLAASIGLGLVLGGPFWTASGPAWSRLLSGVAAVSLHTGAVVWLGMNFTGSTTWTSPTGTLSELRKVLPWLAAGLVLAAGAGIASVMLAAGGQP